MQQPSPHTATWAGYAISHFRPPYIGTTAERALVCLVGLVSVGVFFRHQIGGGFALLTGNRTDGLIETALLEHWFNVLRGREAWDTPDFFFPTTGTLAYNDAYLVYGLLQAMFRAVGLDVVVSSELVNICVKVIGFVSFYSLSRVSCGMNRFFATLGAVLFTLSCTGFVQAIHAQLLSVAFAPLLMLLVERHVVMLPVRSRAAALWGCAAAAVLDLWLMTSFYMAWFMLLLGAAGMLTATACLVAGWHPPARLTLARLWPTALSLLVFVVGTAPFLALYLPKAAETGGHAWAETLLYLPGLLDIVNVGPNNLVFGAADKALNHAMRPNFPATGEHEIGLPPILLLLFALSLPGAQRRGPLVLLASVSCLIAWGLALDVGSATLWHLVYEHVPGAKAVRVVCRIQILLVAPVVLAVTAALAREARRIPAPLLAALCLLLVMEQIDTGSNTGLDHAGEMARLQSIPPAPAGCKAFYAASTRPGPPLMPEEIDGFYSLSVDAMMVAERIGLPTVNGMASFLPPGWDLESSNRPDYANRVQAYLARNHVADACALDLKSSTWR